VGGFKGFFDDVIEVCGKIQGEISLFFFQNNLVKNRHL